MHNDDTVIFLSITCPITNQLTFFVQEGGGTKTCRSVQLYFSTPIYNGLDSRPRFRCWKRFRKMDGREMWMGEAPTLVNVSNRRFVIPASISLSFITKTIWGKKDQDKEYEWCHFDYRHSQGQTRWFLLSTLPLNLNAQVLSMFLTLSLNMSRFQSINAFHPKEHGEF